MVPWAPSNSTSWPARSACTGSGIGPVYISSVVGVAKAYLTRVGSGPFPSEADPERGVRLRDIGAEFGTVTGRERRCGWLDLVGLRFAARVNGMTELILTKLDVLSSFETIPVCTGYRLRDGSVTDEFPPHQSDFHHATGVFEELPGWGVDISRVTSYADLPAAARDYVAWVEERLELPVTMVGVGPRRDQILSPDRVGVA